MEHRKQGWKTLLLLTMGVVFSTGLYGQSVADMARQGRGRRTPQTGRVYTNDDVRSLPPSAPIPSAPAPTAPTPAAAGATGTARPAGQAPTGATGQAAAGQPAAGQAAAAAAPAEKTPAEIEKEYRAKFAELKENLSLEERKLDILQRELNLMQTQYDGDPQRTMTQELTRSNINTRVTEIEAQKAAVDKAKQAIAALEDELRVKGLPAGWAR